MVVERVCMQCMGRRVRTLTRLVFLRIVSQATKSPTPSDNYRNSLRSAMCAAIIGKKYQLIDKMGCAINYFTKWDTRTQTHADIIGGGQYLAG